MNREPFEPGRWRRIEEVFQASLDLPADQRETLLRETCGDDPQLRDEVESLLSRDSPESPLIESIIDNATADLCDEIQPVPPLREVGKLPLRNGRVKP